MKKPGGFSSTSIHSYRKLDTVSRSSKTPVLEYASSSKPWKPHKYQAKAIKFLLERQCAGLFLDPGLGKTSITLGAIKVLKAKGMTKRTLVIAPLRVAHAVWPLEVEKWTDFHGLRVVVLHGSKKDELLKQDADIYVINPEGLSWLLTGKRFQMLRPDILVVDESSKFKHSKTSRFKMLKGVLPKFARRWILTGTPAPNGLLDLFGQAYIMDLGKSLGQYITHYRMKYFTPLDRMGFKWVPQAGSEELIYEQLRPYVLRLAAEDYLELPKLIDNVITVELPAPARKIYDEMEKELISVLDDGVVFTAPSAAAAYIKCRQIANGGLYKTAGPEERPLLKKDAWVKLHDAKTEALVDLVDELQGSPLLVAYGFTHDLYRLQEAFGKDVPYIGSGVSAAKTQELVRRWNAGEIPVLLGHPASMGHGLNMQGAGNHVCWYSLDYDLELYEQFIKRVLRQGNDREYVMNHLLVAKDTIDEVVMRALHRKQKNQNALLDALKDYRVTRATAPSKPTRAATKKR